MPGVGAAIRRLQTTTPAVKAAGVVVQGAGILSLIAVPGLGFLLAAANLTRVVMGTTAPT
jgi:hypothetical protein